MYLDLHGSDHSPVNFVFGNFISYAPKLAKAMLIPRLLSLNSLHFAQDRTSFTPTNFLRFKKSEQTDVISPPKKLKE